MPVSEPAPEISIVVPFWNEEGNVLPLVRQIALAFKDEPRPFELILVDDASTDGTWQQILAARKADQRVRAIRHSHRAGQSAALWTGFQSSRGRILATLDGDLQNDPADLPQMLAQLAHCDMVSGVRVQRMDSLVRRVSSRIARVARRAVLGMDFRDSACNLRAFDRRVLEMIPPFNGFHRFAPILARGGGAAVMEMPVHHRPRTSGQSKYGIRNRLWRGLYDLLMIRWYLKRQLTRIAASEHTDPHETCRKSGGSD